MRHDKRKHQTYLLGSAIHVLAWLPLALLLWDSWQDQLSADPIREITLRTGKTALILLTLSLACTPLNTLLGWKQLLPWKRPLGLYAFLYATLHLATFLWLDYGLNLPRIYEALFEKWYALVGLAAFLILFPLALTSTKWAMRRLGKNWKRLHKWVYLAGMLAVAHYLLLAKQTYTQPVLFALIVLLLLLARIPLLKQRLLRGRRASKRQQIGSISSD